LQGYQRVCDRLFPTAMDMLRRIVEERMDDARRAERIVTMAELRERASRMARRSLAGRIAAERDPAIIAEMKAASPSAGRLCANYEPAALAGKYAEGGAAGISVLTEPRYFLGSAEHLVQVRACAKIPILRKDFIGCEYQVWETAAMGADALLLIVAALDPGLLRDLYGLARVCGLDVVAEAHTEEELLMAAELPEAIIGVNSRNLKTLKTDLNVLRRMAAGLPKERITIAESGISTPEEVRELHDLGYRGFLIGEMLMRSSDPSATIRSLRQPLCRAR